MEKTILFAGGTNYKLKEGVSSILINKADDKNILVNLKLKLLEGLTNIVINSDEIGPDGFYKSLDEVKNFVYLLNKDDRNNPLTIDIEVGDFSITHNRENKTEFIIRGLLGGGGKTEHGGGKTEHPGDVLPK